MEYVKLTLPTHNAPLLRAAAQLLDDYAEAAEADAPLPAAAATAEAPPPATATAEAPPPATTTADAPPSPDDLDTFKRPWDVRIHTVARSKTKDGAWKYKRGVDKALVAQIEAGTGTQAPPPATAQPDTQFAHIAARVDRATDSGLLHPQGVLNVLGGLGLKNMPELAADPTQWQAFSQRLDMLGVPE